MTDLIRPNTAKSSQQTEENYDENLDLLNADDELSQTLLERRKRLHVLASEINQWEDESVKK